MAWADERTDKGNPSSIHTTLWELVGV